MTPAQLDALSRVHRRVHGGKGSRGAGRSEPEQGTTADLLAFSRMKVA